jgi:hypothetical protein
MKDALICTAMAHLVMVNYIPTEHWTSLTCRIVITTALVLQSAIDVHKAIKNLFK